MIEPSWNATVAKLFDSHAQALLLYARQWVGAAGAEDAVQRVFVRLVTSGRLPTEPRTWLFRCVRNEAISFRRSEQRRIRREQTIASEAVGWFIPRQDDLLDVHAVQAALEMLPSDQREVVVLRVWCELTLMEIAAITGLALSTVHARYSSALATMRQKLERPCRNQNR